MKLKNKLGVPEIIKEAILAMPYTAGKSDRTTTRLTDHPKPVRMAEIFKDKISSDVSEMISIIQGNAVHHLLELCAIKKPQRYVAELRVFLEVDGVMCSGQLDLFDLETQEMIDFKFTKVYAAQHPKQDYLDQLLINSYLASTQGFVTKTITNIYFLKDFSKNRAGTEGYPKAEIVPHRWMIESPEEILRQGKEILEKHVARHKPYINAKDESELPPCDAKAKWADIHWVAIKKGAKRASKKFDTEAEAKAYCEEKSHLELEAEERQSAPTRCRHFCPAAPFCKQFETENPNLYKERLKEIQP